MERPYIICHMVTSLDGKVTGDFLYDPACAGATEVYYDINRTYMASTGRRGYACGRVTMEGSFTGGHQVDLTPFENAKVMRAPGGARIDFIADDSAAFFAVAFDRQGRLGWTGPTIVDEDPGYGGAHIVEVVTEQVSDAYLAYLAHTGISYIIAGEEDLDLPLALHKLAAVLGIETLALEGGSVLNGAFQRAGFIDEVSLVVSPQIADAAGKPLFTDAVMENFSLLEAKSYDNCLWLRSKRQSRVPSDHQALTDSQKLARACREQFDLSALSLSDAYYYSSLPLCVIDAVFSIGVKYTSAQNAVLSYCKACGLTPYDRSRTPDGSRRISQLIADLEGRSAQQAADTVFQNHQRTSARSGILKAEAVLHFAKVLQRHGIETVADLYAAQDLAAAAAEVQQIPGQKSGLSWQYFCMLAGDDSLAKPDRHILRFMEKQLGYRPTPQQAQHLMEETAAILHRDHPNITVRLLDYAIWEASAHKKLT